MRSNLWQVKCRQTYLYINTRKENCLNNCFTLWYLTKYNQYCGTESNNNNVTFYKKFYNVLNNVLMFQVTRNHLLNSSNYSLSSLFSVGSVGGSVAGSVASLQGSTR